MKKILIIEDEKNIIYSIKVFLKKLGYEVLIAKNGIEGIQLCEEHRPDLILLDILIPKMNGFLVCETIKNNHELMNIPVIFMSAKVQKDDMNKAYKIGGDDFLIKPFNHEDLKMMIKKYIKEA